MVRERLPQQETRESKEEVPSFEEFKQKVAEALELIRTRELLNPYYPESVERRGGPIRPQRDLRGRVTYRADLEQVKYIPEFAKLIAEEEEILASGASKQEIAKYSTIAERAYQRRGEVLKSIEQKLKDLQRNYYGLGRFIYEAADILFMASSYGERVVDTAVEEALLRERFAAMRRSLEESVKWDKIEKERAELQEKFGERYRELRKNAQAALKGQRMLAELNAVGETARARGFSNPEEMWVHDIEALRKLKEEIGEDKFKQLEDMNRT